jgi:hypothetical protein
LKKGRGISRPFPKHTLEEALKVAQAIHEKNNDKPMKPMFIAEVIGRKPDSSEFRLLLSSSMRYGLTKGSYVSDTIELTPLGSSIVKPIDPEKKVLDLQEAAQRPEVFKRVYEHYRDGKFPIADQFFKNKLEVEFGVPKDYVDECIQLLDDNGRYVGIIRDVAGAPRVVFESAPPVPMSTETLSSETPVSEVPSTSSTVKQPEPAARPIFIAHGKDKTAVEQLKNILSRFNIPSHVAEEEAHMGRLISTKVKETMQKCGSAIFIFTPDEEIQDSAGNKICRPSDNVVYELGAATYLYGNKIVILKEKSVTLASDFSDFGYIPFESGKVDAKATELILELVKLGFLKLTTSG